MALPLAQSFGHAQADALLFEQDNAWLNDLDKEFQNLKGAGKLRIKGKELIEDKFVVLKKFLWKQVVPPFSGARYFGELYKAPQADHFLIAKLESNKAIQHRLLLQFIKDMLLGGVGSNQRLDRNLDNRSIANHNPEATICILVTKIASSLDVV